MTAFLKIDTCRSCHRAIPWEWAPAVLLNGKAMAGPGVWRSQLVDHLCPTCLEALERERAREQHILRRRREIIELLGGEKPFREFTFERYQVAPGNRLAYKRCHALNPATENLYLWGACGAGKTHLVCAAARRSFQETLAVIIQPSGQLSRKTRMKDPAQEQSIMDEFVIADVLVLDDLGAGATTAYWCQLVQEILDRRAFMDRAGLLVTSKYSLDQLATKLADDSIPSRLSGMCQTIEVTGIDGRLSRGTA
jgi:DNA replication protein DnaC